MRQPSVFIIFLLLALGAFPAAPIHAQSPRQAQEQTAPRNAAEWLQLLDAEVNSALGRSNTALNMTAHRTRGSASVAVTISPGGQVTDVQIITSRGKAMDAAYIRSFSGMRLPAFTPDMPQTPFTTTLTMTSTRR